MNAARELKATIQINATDAQVWDALTNFDHLVDASPELVKMIPLKPGGLRAGQWYLGVNRRKGVVWPSRNVVVEVEPRRRLVWDTVTSGARWAYDLTPSDGGTTLTQSRPIPGKLSALGKVFATLLLGGGESHADELEAGMKTTLDHLKQVAESS